MKIMSTSTYPHNTVSFPYTIMSYGTATSTNNPYTSDTVTNTRAWVQVPSHTIMAVPTPLAKTIDPLKRAMREGMGEGQGVSPSSGPTRNNSPTTKSMM